MALIKLRPRSTTVLGQAVLASLFTSALLVAVAFRWRHVGPQVGPLITLLLIVPGGLAAYAARRREHSVTTGTLVGLRALAVVTAFLSFGVAGLVLLGRTWSLNRMGQLGISHGPGFLGPVITGCAITAALVFAVLLRAWRAAISPPEHKRRPGKARPESSPGR